MTALPDVERVAFELLIALAAVGEHCGMGVDRGAAIEGALALWDHAELAAGDHAIAAAMRELAAIALDHGQRWAPAPAAAEHIAVVRTVLGMRLARLAVADRVPWPALGELLDLVALRVLLAAWPARNHVRVKRVAPGVAEVAAPKRAVYDILCADLTQAGLRLQHRLHTDWTPLSYVARVERSETLCRWRAARAIVGCDWICVVDALRDGEWGLHFASDADRFPDERRASEAAKTRDWLPGGVQGRLVGPKAPEHALTGIGQALRGRA